MRPVIALANHARRRHLEGFSGRCDLVKCRAPFLGEFVQARHRLPRDPVGFGQREYFLVEGKACLDPELPGQRLLVAHQLVMVAPLGILEIAGVRLCFQDAGEGLAARPGRYRQSGRLPNLQKMKQRPVDEFRERRVGGEIGLRVEGRVRLVPEPLALFGIMREGIPFGGLPRHCMAAVIARREHRVGAASLGLAPHDVMRQRLGQRPPDIGIGLAVERGVEQAGGQQCPLGMQQLQGGGGIGLRRRAGRVGKFRPPGRCRLTRRTRACGYRLIRSDRHGVKRRMRQRPVAHRPAVLIHASGKQLLA